MVSGWPSTGADFGARAISDTIAGLHLNAADLHALLMQIPIGGSKVEK